MICDDELKHAIKQVVFTCSQLVLGSRWQREPCSSPEAAYTGFSQGQLSGSTSGLSGRTDLHGTGTHADMVDDQSLSFFCIISNERANTHRFLPAS